MRLSELMRGQTYRRACGPEDAEVSGLAHDSRRTEPGCAFFCLSGRSRDGHDFAAAAAARGAVAVVAERPVDLPPGVTCLLVPASRRALALAAAAFRGWPSRRLRLYGVTGTNGKTTVNHLVEAVLRREGHVTGLLGTVENRIAHRTTPATLTTPDALEVQSALAAMVSSGVTRACLEVSSHGLAGHRLGGCEFDVAVLTNVTRDHLDFHGDVRAYAATKLTLFEELGRPRTKAGPAYAVLNSDDQFFALFRDRIRVPVLTYGVTRASHVKLAGALLRPAGSLVRVTFDPRPRGQPEAGWLQPSAGWPEQATLRFLHPGRHNVRNLMAALAVAWAEGCRWDRVLRAVETFPGVRGRWEVIRGPDGVTGVVDFAHNPGGLAQALETARLLARRRVILVFGCEGEKDRGKRPLMGAVAARRASHVILTTDNTFGEDRRRILADVESGLAGPLPGGIGEARATYEVVEDRREAIFRAAAMAGSGDLVIVAGRGHDAKLVSGSRVETLDDREVLAEALAAAHPGRALAAAVAADPGPLGAPDYDYSHSMVAGGLEVTS